MKASLTDLARRTKAVVFPVIRHGREVVLTEFGRPVAKIIPYLETTMVSPEEAREAGELMDAAILEGMREAREDETSRFEE